MQFLEWAGSGRLVEKTMQFLEGGDSGLQELGSKNCAVPRGHC